VRTVRRRWAVVLAVLLVVTATQTSLVAGAQTTAAVFINEIHYDNAGDDTGEAVEVAGPAGTDLAGWSVVLYNGSGGAPYNTLNLGGTIPDEGSGFGAVAVPAPGLQNGAPDGLALVDPSGAVVEFLSYEGVFVASGGPAGGLTSTDIGVVESSDTPVGSSLQLVGTGTDPSAFTWQAGVTESFGCLNAGQVDIAGSCGGSQPEPELTPIHVVQGTGDTSPLAGQRVTVAGVVVGDYEGPGPANLRGFYIQEQEPDADPATSEGLFVFHGDEDSVDLGDVVEATGAVAEFQGQTQLNFPESLQVIETGASVEPTPVTLPLDSPGDLERYEGMLVTFPQELTVTEHFQLGRFGQVVVSSGGRLQQPTAVAEPGADANAVQAANNLNRLIIDDARNDQNPDPIIFGRGGQPLTAGNTLRGGDTITGATGVLTYTWAGNAASGNAYRLRPPSVSETFVFEANNPRPEGSPDVGGSVRVASFNVLNYFLTLGNSGDLCGVVPEECRGADDEVEFQRQRTKLIAALVELDADILGLMELENTPGVSPESDLAAGLNDVLGDGTYAAVDAGTVGDDVIRVGMLHKPGAVTPVGEPDIVDYGDGRNRASLAQTFRDNTTGEVFSVVVNHFKSKGCDDATGADVDQGDGQGCWNATRVAAAEQLVAAMEDLGHGDDDWLVIGDLNSYDYEDPIDVFSQAGFVDLLRRFEGDEAYGYVFDGQWGYLDHGLASPSLVEQVTGADSYHINADEPNVIDYNTDFKSDDQIEVLYAPDEFRTSDHDPIVVGLDLRSSLGKLKADPDELWPPNHKLRDVDVKAGNAQVDILDVVSSEPDVTGPDDEPGDIQIVDSDTVRLRAERYSRDGRTYTIRAIVSGDGQVRYDTAEVRVPHSKRRSN
jgi:predicted extracellular nuclease